MRAPRRTIVELQELYDSYKSLEPTHELSEISSIISVSPVTLRSWRKGGRPKTLTKYPNGFTFGKWTVVNRFSYLASICRCGVCGGEQRLTGQVIGKAVDIRCRRCKPDLNMDEVLRLSESGFSAVEIADKLGVTYFTIKNAERRLGLGNEECEYSFREIAETLNISNKQVLASFNSAMKKITISCNSVDMVQYLSSANVGRLGD